MEDGVIPCPLCGETAHRQSVYYEQYTITETGGVKGPTDRLHRDSTGAKLEHLYNSQRETQRETGDTHGLFKIKDYNL